MKAYRGQSLRPKIEHIVDSGKGLSYWPARLHYTDGRAGTTTLWF
jgi:hypothetical protein